MQERYDPSEISRQQEPTDIKVAKVSKTIDKVQIAAGVGLMVFTPLVALGATFVVWNGAQHIATDKYINWRMNKREQKSQAKLQQLPQAA